MSNSLFFILNEATKLSNYDINVIIGNEPKIFPQIKNNFVRKIFKKIALIISHIDLGIKVRKNKHRDATIIYGFSTELLLFTYIFSLFWTKNVYLLNHHNIQQAFENKILKLLLNVYHFLNYKFIVNETSSVLKDLGYSERKIKQHISLLFPVPVIHVDSANLLSSDDIKNKKVGIIGQVRSGKQFDKTIDALTKLQNKLDFLLIIGTDDFSPFSELNLDKVKLVDTSSREDYFAVLASCDIIVLNYEKSKYLYRCSGVAADAISTRTYVICPNFPLMSSQIKHPTPVGVLYDQESDLEMVLKQALELAPSEDNTAFESHYTERSIEKMVSVLDQAIQARS